jgi:hypothetical protein
VKNHEPVSVEEFDEVDEFLSSKSQEISAHFQKHAIPFEEDDFEAIKSELKQALVEFILDSKAVPLRSPHQLAATVKCFVDDPAEFVTNQDRYDPEAVAKVMAVLGRDPEIRNALLRFEGGLDPPPSAETIRKAAIHVIKEITEQKARTGRRGGRTADELQKDLAIELARIHAGFGGSIKRRVHDREYGPFHEFLEIVLPAVKKHAILAKSSLTITSMVRAALEDPQRFY